MCHSIKSTSPSATVTKHSTRPSPGTDWWSSTRKHWQVGSCDHQKQTAAAFYRLSSAAGWRPGSWTIRNTKRGYVSALIRKFGTSIHSQLEGFSWHKVVTEMWLKFPQLLRLALGLMLPKHSRTNPEEVMAVVPRLDRFMPYAHSGAAMTSVWYRGWWQLYSVKAYVMCG